MTCRTWSRSRMRRGSGNPRTLLSICGALVFSANLSGWKVNVCPNRAWGVWQIKRFFGRIF
jgi:hypothetical protein